MLYPHSSYNLLSGSLVATDIKDDQFLASSASSWLTFAYLLLPWQTFYVLLTYISQGTRTQVELAGLLAGKVPVPLSSKKNQLNRFGQKSQA
ncbi:hypothetical protein K449DRAFT_380024 [Hypoxylon sp. EC38]|nr:hypothetical protein K449DRAFT_380024 [Hypoxylon sp. EC38]